MRLPFLLLALFVWVFAVPPIECSQADEGLVIRSNTRLVSLEVVARDKAGKPVSGLGASDFEVLDNGKAQQFRVLRGPGTGATEPATAADTAARRLGLPPQLPPHIRTNAPAADGVPQAVSVILFDALNTPVDDQRYAKAQILKLLRALKPSDRVGLFVLGERLRIVHDYSSDASSLLKELGLLDAALLANPETESSLTQLLNNAKLEQILGGGDVENQAQSQIFTDQQIALTRLQGRIQKTFDALEAIAQRLAPVPGRKNLLWVSAAFPMVVSTDLRTGTGSPQTFGVMGEQTMRAIANSGVAVYPIDARGVMVDPLYKAKSPYRDYAMAQVIGNSRSRGGRRGGRATFTNPDPMVFGDRDETDSHHDVMVELAKRTGGKAAFHTNDTAGVLREALNEADESYTLAWYPNNYEENGRYRRITVKAKREGLTLRYRDGYFAAAAPDNQKGGSQIAGQREEMLVAMQAPMELGAVAFAAQLERDGGKLQVTLKVDPAAVTLSEAKGQWLGRVDVVLLYLDAKGESVGGGEEALPLRLNTANREAALQNGFVYQSSVPWNEAAQKLVIAVRDAPSGRIGTLHVELATLAR